MESQPDSVACGKCQHPFPADAVPATCPACGDTSRTYIVGQIKPGEPRMATVKVTTYPPEVLVGGAAPGESTARDEVRVAYAVRPGVSERQRLLARITALAKAIEHIALGINADDLGDDVFIGRTPDLMRALGLAMGTQKDIGDGRVLDES